MTFLFILQVIFYILGAGAGFIFKRQEETANRLMHLCAVLASGIGMGYALAILLGKATLEFWVPLAVPFGEIHIAVNPLSAFFVFLISLITFATSIYAIGYVREYYGKKNIALLGFFYHTFLLAMVLVVSIQNAFCFLIFWELMSLASYFLVVFEHEKPEARQAGLLYLVMTHFGTAFIAVAFWLLFLGAGSFSFEIFRQSAGALPPASKNLIFFCVLSGFGMKAGVIPLHIWLPAAHPQAPSHVSALMSGVMIKTALYALCRFLFDFLQPVPVWWGIVILAVAIVSTLLGILYALMEQDLKRLLAFSSIENIGIMLLSLGMAVIFKSSKQPVYAVFAIAVFLYHGLNHAVFKGLLFLGAGSVLSRTHTRNMENLGGLIKKMPWTAACFLIGAVAISALPPLNGFVSEWMTFMVLLLGFENGGAGIRFFSPLLAALLGLAGALAATCFVKAFGITFLGKPRSVFAEHAAEADWTMKIGMGILAAGCFGLAVFASAVVRTLGVVAKTLVGQDSAAANFTVKGVLIVPSGFSRISPLFIGLVLGICILGVWIAVRILLKKQTVRITPSWDCGMPQLTGRMQYTATGYANPIRRIFSFLYQPTRRVELEKEGHEILRMPQRFDLGIRPLFEETIYRPAVRIIFYLSEKAKRIQTGHIQLYLSFIFITLVLLLLFVRIS